ncbi:MAG: HAMP domain-containing protein [Planctomycetes bacterium]|nr:HAMP domain-containing protein [Planctomycetota bacterium]
MSLRYKIFLGAGLTMILVVGLLSLRLAVDSLTRADAERRRIGNLVFHVVQEWISDQKVLGTGSGGAEMWVEVSRRLSRSDLFRSWIIVDFPRTPLAWSTELDDLDAARADPEFHRVFDSREVLVAGSRVYVPLYLPDSDEYVVLRNDIRHLTVSESSLVDSIKSDLGILGLGTLLLLLILYVLLNSLVVRPLEALSEASGRIAAGDYTHEIPELGRADELSRLVDGFNAMLRNIRDYHGTLQARIEEASEKIRETQRRLVVAQRLSATGTLAAGIAHEINNPLGGMINAARTLARPDLDAERRVVYLELIVEGLNRIAETVKQVLQFTPRQPQARPIEIRPIVDRAVALVQHRVEHHGIQLANDVPADLPLIFAEPQELQQVFVNLLINAADAIGERPGAIRIFTESRPGELVIAFRDDGCGMDESEVERAFDLFFTTKPAGVGTGLGLAVVANIVQNHGGKVEIESTKGVGTTLRLSLPVMRPGVEPPTLPLEAPGPRADPPAAEGRGAPEART